MARLSPSGSSTILLAFTARATDAPLLSDAHISSAHPSTNFGSLTNLAVGNGNTALIQFNLGSLPAGTTSGEIAVLPPCVCT